MFVVFHTLIAPSLLNFQYVDTTVILESKVKELTINISDILPRGVSCRVDCNFPGCNLEIVVKRNSQPYRQFSSDTAYFKIVKQIIPMMKIMNAWWKTKCQRTTSN